MKPTSPSPPRLGRKCRKAQMSPSELCLQKLINRHQLHYNTLKKWFPSLAHTGHARRPRMDDILDRYLWAFEVWQDAENSALRSLSGPVIYCPQSTNEILDTQNSSCPTMELFPLSEADLSFQACDKITDKSNTIAPPMAIAL